MQAAEVEPLLWPLHTHGRPSYFAEVLSFLERRLRRSPQGTQPNSIGSEPDLKMDIKNREFPAPQTWVQKLLISGGLRQHKSANIFETKQATDKQKHRLSTEYPYSLPKFGNFGPQTA